MIPRVEGKVKVRLPKFARGKETTYVEREITETGAMVNRQVKIVAGMHICQEGLVPDHEEGKKCWYSLKQGFRPKGGPHVGSWRHHQCRHLCGNEHHRGRL